MATLPGESHGLGLQIAALVLSSAGLRVLGLGTEVPPLEIAALAQKTNAAAVGISVSIAGRESAPKGLATLRASLQKKTQLVVGGAGAPSGFGGAPALRDLRGLLKWAESLTKVR